MGGTKSQKIVILGCGFVGQTLAPMLDPAGAILTSRDQRKLAHLAHLGFSILSYDANKLFSDEFLAAIDGAIVVNSLPPLGGQDATAQQLADYWANIKGQKAKPLHMIYLSTTAPYGNRDGGWAFEWQVATPNSDRGAARLNAENQWQALLGPNQVTIFRLPGIYGPGRSAFDQLKSGRTTVPDLPGHIFSRCHAQDIANAIFLAIKQPKSGIYNLCDDYPCAAIEPLAFAANLLNVAAPKLVPLSEANLSEMALSFYADNKRISNARTKSAFGWRPQFPNYQAGLTAIFNGDKN